MKKYKNLLLIGGTGRNVGKTECLCRVIQKIAAEQVVYALKVSAMYPDELEFHGDHGNGISDFQLFEEKNSTGHKDTSRMLLAGAKRVFYLHSDGTQLMKGFYRFMDEISPRAPIVCESNSLGSFLEPGLMVMLQSTGGMVKERAKPQLAKADMVILSDGASGFSGISRIHFTPESGWQLD